MSHQLPVYSPLTAGAVLRSLFASDGSTDRLRTRLAERFGVDPESVVLTGSGTQALGLAIGLTCRGGGLGTVALPAYTCWDVGTAAQSAGVTASYFDLNPNDLSPDLASLEAVLRSGVDAAVVSPVYGYPVNWDEIHELTKAYGCPLIEDAAQGHGTFLQDRPVGSFGDLSMVSFGRGKGWTGGGGGALLVRTEAFDPHDRVVAMPRRRIRATIRWAGMAFAQALLGRPTLYGVPSSLPTLGLGETVYHPPGEAMTMLPGTAALALHMESRADEEVEIRRRWARELWERLDAVSHIRIIRPALSGGGFLRLAIRIPDVSPGSERSMRPLGIERGYPLALPDVPELRKTSSAPIPQNAGFPGARSLARELYTLPTHSHLRAPDVDRIVAALSGH